MNVGGLQAFRHKLITIRPPEVQAQPARRIVVVREPTVDVASVVAGPLEGGRQLRPHLIAARSDARAQGRHEIGRTRTEFGRERGNR